MCIRDRFGTPPNFIPRQMAELGVARGKSEGSCKRGHQAEQLLSTRIPSADGRWFTAQDIAG
eukprot:6208381-Alexandrium_andersonii.AAC.1